MYAVLYTRNPKKRVPKPSKHYSAQISSFSETTPLFLGLEKKYSFTVYLLLLLSYSTLLFHSCYWEENQKKWSKKASEKDWIMNIKENWLNVNASLPRL